MAGKYIQLVTENMHGDSCNCWSFGPDKERTISENEDGTNRARGNLFLYKNVNKRDDGKNYSDAVQFDVSMAVNPTIQNIYEAIIAKGVLDGARVGPVNFSTGIIQNG